MRSFPSYLLQTPGGIFHLRVSVPTDLRSIFGVREVKRSLQTTERKQATVAAREIATRLNTAFEQIRYLRRLNSGQALLGLSAQCD